MLGIEWLVVVCGVEDTVWKFVRVWIVFVFIFFSKSEERGKRGTGWAEDAAAVSTHQDSFTWQFIVEWSQALLERMTLMSRWLIDCIDLIRIGWTSEISGDQKNSYSSYRWWWKRRRRGKCLQDDTRTFPPCSRFVSVACVLCRASCTYYRQYYLLVPYASDTCFIPPRCCSGWCLVWLVMLDAKYVLLSG